VLHTRTMAPRSSRSSTRGSRNIFLTVCGASLLAALAACGSDNTTAPQGLATITVSPDTVVLAPGGTQQFSAVGADGSGNPVTISPTWGIENGAGSMSGDGLFTAADGPDTVTVTAKSGSITGRATVIVTAASPDVAGDYALQSVDGKAPPDTVVHNSATTVVFLDGTLSLHADSSYKLLFHTSTTTSAGTVADSSGSTGTFTVNGNTVIIRNSSTGDSVVATAALPTISYEDGGQAFVFSK
jgi:hypothetical protein